LSDANSDLQKINSLESGKIRHFEPTWLKVQMDNRPEHHSQLTVGKFLMPDEQLEMADASRPLSQIEHTTQYPPNPDL
jgi:hypothetical protein